MLNQLSDEEQALYSEVLHSIAGQRLLPGRRLTEEGLAEAFDVSRSRVRQVLLLLEADGIVMRQRNKGAYIHHPSPTEAFEIFETRRLIELHLLESAVSRVTAFDIATLEGILAKKQEAMDTENSANVTRLAGEFHLQLASVSRHQTLLGVLQPLIYKSYLAITLYQKGAFATRAQHAHVQIVKHLTLRDVSALRSQMVLHFEHVFGEMDFSDNDPPSRFDQFLNE